MTQATRTRTTTAGPDGSVARLRPAGDDDVEAIVGIWHRGWQEVHLGHVPDVLVSHRRPDDLRRLVPPRLDTTTVATVDGAVVGFVMIHDDEIEHIYVDGPARGTGAATALLAHAESAIGARFGRAWLAVVAGNARARRFYERHRWFDAGPFDNPARTPGGTVVSVPTHRYEKRLT